MATSYYWLPKFDPYAEFVVAAWPLGFTVSGYQPKPGEPFDKSSINSLRILEELYVKRWIAVATPDHATPLPPLQSPTSETHSSRLLTKAERKRLRQQQRAAA
jgi:hypothetical protein